MILIDTLDISLMTHYFFIILGCSVAVVSLSLGLLVSQFRKNYLLGFILMVLSGISIGVTTMIYQDLEKEKECVIDVYEIKDWKEYKNMKPHLIEREENIVKIKNCELKGE